MSDKPLPFVITDRRKFDSAGELRPDADPSPEKTREPEPPPPPPPAAEPAGPSLVPDPVPDPSLPPPPTPDQMEQSRLAYEATADRLETAIRSANPGMDHAPAMSFEQIVQSVYMQAILQLGGGTQEGQQPQVDLLGAKQSIDMLSILAVKSTHNLNPAEDTLISSAIFELRLAFLEITQALARSAAQRAGTPEPPTPGTPTRPGPSIVR